MDTSYRQRSRRQCAVLLELASHHHDLVACGRGVAKLLALTSLDCPQELAVLRRRMLHLMHRHDQLAAEVRSVTADTR